MSEQDRPEAAPTDNPAEAATPPKDLRLEAALVRTGFSSEQTLMSWIRTSLSLLTFGFSIAQFFDYLNPSDKGGALALKPQYLGMSLICVGIVVLVLAALEHTWRIRMMKRRGLPEKALSILPICSALALLLIGIIALMSIALRWSL